jgi:hypothetical protein
MRHGGLGAVSVANGSLGIMAALLAAGVEPNTRVVVPALTWPGAFFCVIAIGATPVVVDLAEDWPVMDAGKVAAAIDKRTRAVLSVGLWGHLAGIPEIDRICQERGVLHILDAAQLAALPSEAHLGTAADMVVLSFGGGKALSGGEGGMVMVRKDHDLLDRLIHVGQHPFRIHSEVENEDLILDAQGCTFNMRLHPMTAIIGLRAMNRESAAKCQANNLRSGPVEPMLPPDRLEGRYSDGVHILFNSAGLPAEDFSSMERQLDQQGYDISKCPYPPFGRLGFHVHGRPFPWSQAFKLPRHPSQKLASHPLANRWAGNLLVAAHRPERTADFRIMGPCDCRGLRDPEFVRETEAQPS